MQVIDLFSGAGGFSLGFKNAGFKIIGAIEADTWAAETFAFNHRDASVIQSKIEKVTDHEILHRFSSSRPDILLGGPPCQGFSICNKNNGDPKDPRNSLFKDFIRVSKLLNPSVVIMENVPNLAKAKTQSQEHVIDIIQNEFSTIGYYVYLSTLEAVHYGVPQIRKRLFIIASKYQLTSPFPEPTHSIERTSLLTHHLQKTPTLWDAISDLPVIQAREGSEVMAYESDPLNQFQEKMRKGSELLHNHLAMKHTKRMVERFQSMKCGESTLDVPESLRPYKRNSGGVISNKIYSQNNRRMQPDKPCHTIPASFYANFVHPYQHRNFTAREGARIQTFPDTYIFKGKPTVVSHKSLAREGRYGEKRKATNMRGLKRTVRKYGKVLGHRRGTQGTELLDYLTARQQIYLPAYRWVLDNCLQPEIEQLRRQVAAGVVLLDYETNGDVTDLHRPLSHAHLVKQYLEATP